MIKSRLKQLLCRHEFKHVESYCLDDKSKTPGALVAKGYVCSKCAKEDFRFVVGSVEIKL